MGLPAMVNYFPEYVSLFDNAVDYFVGSPKMILRLPQGPFGTPKDNLVEMGKKGGSIVKDQRDYKVLSEVLIVF